MKINILTGITDLDGKAIPIDPGKPDVPLLLADVLTTALLSAPHPPGSDRPADQAVKRYDLALAINKARKLDASGVAQDPEVEISADMAVLLKADVNRLYGPLASGQVLPMLDGK